MAIYGSNGSSWLPVASGDLKASDGSSWKTVKKAYRSTGSGWSQVYVGNDPQTYYFVSSGTKAGRGTTWKTNSSQGGSNYPQIGRYETSYGVFPWYGLINFNLDTSGVSLATRMAERPIVKSAYFNIARWNSGGFGSGYGDFYVGRYLGNYNAGSPSNTYCDFSAYAGKNYNATPAGRVGTTVYYNDGYLTRSEFVGGDPIGFPNQGNIAGNGMELGGHRQSLVSHLTGGALCISHTLSNHGGSRGLGSLYTASYSEQANFWNFWPAGATVYGVNIGPTLIVTLDYA
jgi:hypothetical protein